MKYVNYNYLFSLEWKETKRPLKVLHGIHEVEEMRVQILLVTLHSQTNHLNLVSIHLVKGLGVNLIIHSDLPNIADVSDGVVLQWQTLK